MRHGNLPKISPLLLRGSFLLVLGRGTCSGIELSPRSDHLLKKDIDIKLKFIPQSHIHTYVHAMYAVQYISCTGLKKIRELSNLAMNLQSVTCLGQI